MVDPRPLYNVKDIARIFGLTESGARALCRRRAIPAFKVGATYYVDPIRLEAFFREKELEKGQERDEALRFLRGVSSRGVVRPPVM